MMDPGSLSMDRIAAGSAKLLSGLTAACLFLFFFNRNWWEGVLLWPLGGACALAAIACVARRLWVLGVVGLITPTAAILSARAYVEYVRARTATEGAFFVRAGEDAIHAAMVACGRDPGPGGDPYGSYCKVRAFLSDEEKEIVRDAIVVDFREGRPRATFAIFTGSRRSVVYVPGGEKIDPNCEPIYPNVAMCGW